MSIPIRIVMELLLFLLIFFGLGTLLWWKMGGSPLTWDGVIKLMLAGMAAKNITRKAWGRIRKDPQVGSA